MVAEQSLLRGQPRCRCATPSTRCCTRRIPGLSVILGRILLPVLRALEARAGIYSRYTLLAVLDALHLNFLEIIDD